MGKYGRELNSPNLSNIFKRFSSLKKSIGFFMSRDFWPFWIDKFKIDFLKNSTKSFYGCFYFFLFLCFCYQSETLYCLLGCCSEYHIIFTNPWIYLKCCIIISSENQPIQRTNTRKRYISLPSDKCIRKIHHCSIKSHSLRLMYGDGPGKT
mgnify:FL=1